MKKNRIWIIAAIAAALLLVGLFLGLRSCNGGEPDMTEPSGTQPNATQPIGATDPSGEATNPSGATEPGSPTEPTAPSEPTDPTDPTEPKHEHSYTAQVVEPTCTEGGYTVYTCACGESYRDAETASLGHDLHTQTAAPTCGEDGYTREVCARCGYADITSVTKSSGHAYTATVTNATCEEGAKTVYTCTVCGHSYSESTGKAKGHTWGAWTTTKEATCTEDGTQSRTCSVCGKAETQSIDSLGHDIENATRTEPTCTEDGSITGVCAVCGETVTQVVRSTGHDWGEWTSDGADETRTCSVCGETEKLEHTHEWEHYLIEETCTTGGKDGYICKICGSEDWQAYWADKGHKFGEPVVTREATVTECGEEQRTCTVCGEVATFVTRPLDPETGKAPENYIDPRVEFVDDKVYRMQYYQYRQIRVRDEKRTWGSGVSIWVNEDDSVTIVYYQQDGTKVEDTVQQPRDNAIRTYKIWWDGTNKTTDTGKFS